MSDTLTEGIRIQIQSRYLREQSDPKQRKWVFAYHVQISNEGDQAARLLNRHWIITDGWGKTEEVRGPGVVGEQPYLIPGDSFEYTSFCPLPTPTGFMEGSYEMQREDGSVFFARIDRFALVEPSHLN